MDKNKLHHLFKTVIVDTFMKNGLGNMATEIKEEIETKEKYLESDFESNGENRYFLIALDGEEIIGSIEFGPASKLISEYTNNVCKGIKEIGTVFIAPEYQRKGIGNLLLNKMFLTLTNKGIDEFCLDSGYKSAQTIWKKKFGCPEYLLKDYWGKGLDHMIWKVRIDKIQK